MPFTLSHPAVVLPFARALARRRLLSAVVIGSMVPDFGWFLPWHPARFETHSADALLTFCLPVGLFAYWLFQLLIKEPLIEVLPPGAYARWFEWRSRAAVSSLRQWLLAACGVLFGAMTHLVWDAFTHEGGRGVRLIPALEEPMVELGGRRLAGAHLLQDANSVLGLLVVIAILAYGLRPGPPEEAARPRRMQSPERRVWIGAYLVAAGTVSALSYFRRGHALPSMHVSNLTISIMRGGAFALFTIGLSIYLRLKLRPAEPVPGLTGRRSRLF